MSRDVPVNDWEAFAGPKRKANDERNPDEPEPGVKYLLWRWPTEWGNPIERFPSRSPWGRPCETLVFNNRERVKRFTIPIHGWA